MTINTFFNNSIGVWDSNRIYYNADQSKIKFKKLKFEIKRIGTTLWEVHVGKTVHGFDVEKPGLDESIVKRINSVSGIDEMETVAKTPNEAQLLLTTIDTTNELSYSESIVFIEKDLRLRTSTIYSFEGKVILLGSYIEKRN